MFIDVATLIVIGKYEEKDGIEYRPFEPVTAKLDEDWTMYENIENVMLND